MIRRDTSKENKKFDPKELLQAIETKVHEPEVPEYNDHQYWKIVEHHYDITSLLSDYEWFNIR